MRINISTMLTVAGLWFLSTGDTWAQTEDGLARAGCPHQVANYARVGYGSRYVAYFV